MRTSPCRPSQSLHGASAPQRFCCPTCYGVELELASLRHAFDDGSEGEVCGDDARQREPGERIQASELCFRALATARAHQHIDIVRSCSSARFRLIDMRWVDAFDS